ncbi:MAG: BMP family ABC transporter substrate-binding protein [Firmicutes bacterium]|nr:BMP family ABC transporter substrate-binding protein [Bacillota bacterium]
MKRWMPLLIITLILVLSIGCSQHRKSPENPSSAGQGGNPDEMKVAFVYIGPVGDAGWTAAHDNARKLVEKELPWVKTSFIESVAENADSERVMNEYARKGYKVVFATSLGHMDFLINAANENPNTIFMHCSGYKTAPNASTYFGRIEQPRYLSGIVAGKMTKTNIIGYVAAHPVPEVIRGINAFTRGVRSVNPKAVVKVVWTHSWYDPAKEREAAESLLDMKADVIAQHQDTAACQQAAEKRGCYSIGYNTDMSAFAPKAHLTAPIWRWEKYYVPALKSVKDGTWKNTPYWGGLKEGVVDLAPFGPMVPEDVKKLVQEQRKLMEDEKLDWCTGPVKDQEGKERVKTGETMSYDDQMKMNWFVEGVEGDTTE